MRQPGKLNHFFEFLLKNNNYRIPKLSKSKAETVEWPQYKRNNRKWMHLKGGSHIKPIDAKKKNECSVWRAARDIEYNEYCMIFCSKFKLFKFFSVANFKIQQINFFNYFYCFNSSCQIYFLNFTFSALNYSSFDISIRQVKKISKSTIPRQMPAHLSSFFKLF